MDNNSPDQTSAAARELARAKGRGRGVQRPGRRGLEFCLVSRPRLARRQDFALNRG